MQVLGQLFCNDRSLAVDHFFVRQDGARFISKQLVVVLDVEKVSHAQTSSFGELSASLSKRYEYEDGIGILVVMPMERLTYCPSTFRPEVAEAASVKGLL